MTFGERIDQLIYLFNNFDFARYALLVGVLIAFCSSLLGVTLVLRRLSFIGSGLSHVSFGSTTIVAAIAMIIGVESFQNNFFFVLPITILCSIWLLLSGPNSKIKGDSALAMLSVGSLAVGYLFMNIFPKSANVAADICTVLFGSTAILTLGSKQWLVWLCVGLSVLVSAMFLLFYNKIFAITFDEDFASATGIKAKTYNAILAIIIAVIIVLAMNLVGALLVSALVVFPALTAMRVFKSFKAVTICSVIVSVFCSTIGILLSAMYDNLPLGSVIVAVNLAVFILFAFAGLAARRKKA
ncbi:MAG: metal ABC transporter permease [Oscillospiraceae bacterium]|nr:metal ABC transporter permease [Oscillospiraceae bacterium]